MNLICRVATVDSFTVHQVLEDLILVVLNDIRHSTVSHGEDATRVACRRVRKGTRNAKILQIGNLLLDDVDPSANVS